MSTPRASLERSRVLMERERERTGVRLIKPCAIVAPERQTISKLLDDMQAELGRMAKLAQQLREHLTTLEK